MSTSSETHSSSSSDLEPQDLHDLLVCKLCRGPLLEPRLLPCLHTFCSPCLEKVLDARRLAAEVKCPVCNSQLDRFKDSTRYSSNLLAASMIQEYDHRLTKTRQVCAHCNHNKQRKATLWCTSCKEYYCDTCNRAHVKSFTKPEQHQVVGIELLKRRTSERYSKVSNKEGCPVHPRESIKVFCTECKVPLCLTCKVTKHNMHSCETIEEAGEGYKSELQSSLNDLNDRLESTNASMYEWMMYNVELEQREERVMNALEQYRQELMDTINAWHRHSVTVVKKSCDQERNLIKSHTDNLQKTKVALETASLYGNTLVDHGKDAQVAVLKYEVKKRIDDLLKTEVSDISSKLRFKMPCKPEKFGPQLFGVIEAIKLSQAPQEPIQIMTPTKEKEVFSPADSPVFSFKADSLTDQADPWLTGVDVMPDGNVVVADRRNSVIKFFSMCGKLEKSVYVADLLDVMVSNPSRMPEGGSGLGGIWDCAVVRNTQLLLATCSGLLLYNTATDTACMIQDQHEFTSVTSDGRDMAVTYNNTKSCVQIYDIQSNDLISSFNVQSKRTFGWIATLAYDREEDLIYVMDVHKDCIKVYSHKGKLVREIGKHGRGRGEMVRPRGMVIQSGTDGTVLVADKGNHRILRFRKNGTIKAVVLAKSNGLEAPTGIAFSDQEKKMVIITEKGLVHIVREKQQKEKEKTREKEKTPEEEETPEKEKAPEE